MLDCCILNQKFNIYIKLSQFIIINNLCIFIFFSGYSSIVALKTHFLGQHLEVGKEESDSPNKNSTPTKKSSSNEPTQSPDSMKSSSSREGDGSDRRKSGNSSKVDVSSKSSRSAKRSLADNIGTQQMKSTKRRRNKVPTGYDVPDLELEIIKKFINTISEDLAEDFGEMNNNREMSEDSDDD